MMDARTKEIYNAVMNALQYAEEMGGPEGMQYIKLMDAIINEVSARKTVFMSTINKLHNGLNVVETA